MAIERNFTEAEILALPEMPFGDAFTPVTDPVTGMTSFERQPQKFLVNLGDVFAYRLSNGSHWFVGEDVDGKLYRQRRD